MRPINADALEKTLGEWEWIRNYWTEAFTGGDAGSEFADMIEHAETIDAVPSAQPERKKGKWHQRFYPKVEMMVCSECGNEFSYDAETGVRDYNFCPNCGADMRGEAE